MNDENKIIKKIITIGNEYNHEVFIVTGLEENDTLVNAGAKLVKTGDLVKISNN